MDFFLEKVKVSIKVKLYVFILIAKQKRKFSRQQKETMHLKTMKIN